MLRFNLSRKKTKTILNFWPYYLAVTLCLIVCITIANILSGLILRSIDQQFFSGETAGSQHGRYDSGKLPSQYRIGKPFKVAVEDSSKPLVVEFYADWCPHCKRITPIFHKVSKKVKKVNFASVDTQREDNFELIKKYNINKFPTFIIIDTNTGNFKEIPLTRDSFNVEGLKRQVETSTKKINDIEMIEKVNK